MTQAEFTSFMVQRGCTYSNKTFCGSFNGIPFTVVYNKGRSGGRTTVWLRVQFEGQKVPRKMTKDLVRQYRGQLSVVAYGDNSLLSLQLNTRNDADFTLLFDNLLQSIALLAQQYALPLPMVCPVCKTTGCDAYAFTKGQYRPVHTHCVHGEAQKKYVDAERRLASGNYATGAIGAILGAIVGIIPSLLLLMAGYISAWLCALIPLGAYYGYKLLRGKMNKAVIGFVILASLLAVPFLHYAFNAIEIWNEFSVFMTPGDYIGLIPSFSTDVWLSVGQILLFTALGVAIVSGIIGRTSHHEMEDASFTAASLRPMDGVAAPAAQPVAQPAPVVYGSAAPQDIQ